MVKKKGRIFGFDVARSFAILGMILVNFRVVLSEAKMESVYDFFTVLFEGQAAGLFVVLAGVGISLMTNRARRENDSVAFQERKKILITRALFLLIVGILFIFIWPADILHYYAFYILIGIFVLSVEDKWLLRFAGIVIVVFLLMFLNFNYWIDWNWETLDYAGFWTFEGFVKNLFFNGFHPIFPWVAFVFVGMWLGRQNFDDPAMFNKLLKYSVFGIILSIAISFILIFIFSHNGIYSVEDLKLLFGFGPIPPLPIYIIFTSSLSVFFILVCLKLSDRYSSGWLVRWLSISGQMALTIYFAHVIIGMGLLENVLLSGSFVFYYSIGFWAFFVLFSVLWRKKFKRGPVETVMRKIT